MKKLMLPNEGRWRIHPDGHAILAKSFSYVMFDARQFAEDWQDAAAVAACWWYEQSKTSKMYHTCIDNFESWQELTTAESLDGCQFEPWKVSEPCSFRQS